MSTETATTSIRERLRGQHLLVTGATGFLAKQFVEKILRCVDSIDGITLLVRPGREKNAADRVAKDLLPSSVFNRLRASLGDRFGDLWRDKIHAVAGDLTQDKLGLTSADYAALKARVTLIVNSAATVTFDEQLDLAVALNTLGPSRLLAFAQDCGDIPFLHVSTCYVCGAVHGAVPEDFRVPESAVGKLAQLADGTTDLDGIVAGLQKEAREVRANFNDNQATTTDACREALIAAGMQAARQRGWNDTYTFTKWLGEQILLRDRGNVPLTIFRPAIIEGSYDEPEPGWIDGLRMADPLIAAYGRGKLQEFPGDPDTSIDLIPVDFVVNGMIATLPVGRAGTEPPRVYQCASSARNPLVLHRMTAALRTAFLEHPMHDEDGCPILPAPLKLSPQKLFLRQWEARRERLKKLQSVLEKINWTRAQRRARKFGAAVRQMEQIIYFARIYAPYTSLDVQYQDENLRAVAAALNPADQATFPCDTKCIDWEDYVINRHVPGVRNFVLGTGLEPNARIRGLPVKSTGAVAENLATAKTVFDVFRTARKRYPDKAAFQVRRGSRWLRYTFAEADAATGTIVRRFQEAGLKAGERVAICAENGPEWVLTYLAIQRAGLTAIPLDPQLPPVEAWAAARFAEAKMLCAGEVGYAGLEKARPQDAAKISLVQLRAPFVPPPGASRDAAPDAVPFPSSQPASILFTSGTTVAPKAVPLLNANFLANVRDMAELHPNSPNEEFLSVLPLYHALEFTGGFVYPLAIGATITYVDRISGPEIIAAMQATGTTIMITVPRILALFRTSIEEKTAAKGKLAQGLFAGFTALAENFGTGIGRTLFGGVHRAFGGRLRIFVSGGSALDPDLYAFWARMGFHVYEGYGLTETSPVLTMTPPGTGHPGSAGQLLGSVEMEIRQTNSQGIGEVWVRGASVFAGYLGNPAATAEVLQKGWFHTGDLGRLDDRGLLFLTGRSKDLIVTSAGKNVYPDEVEMKYHALSSTELNLRVKELCVLGMPTASGAGEAVHAVVVLAPTEGDSPADFAAITTRIRTAAEEIGREIPGYQRIAKFHFWREELPKTSTLKAKRNQIRDRLLTEDGDQPDALSDSAAPTSTDSTALLQEAELSPAQSALYAILTKQTRIPEDKISPNLSLLADLGIDSIGKLDVLARIEEAFGFTIEDDAGAKAATVGDFLTIIGARNPLGHRDKKKRHTAGEFRQNGIAPWLLPARWSLDLSTRIFLNSYVRVYVRGQENIPTEGAFLLAANHASHLDTPAVLQALGGQRRVWMVGAEDYFFSSALKRLVFGKVLDMIAFDRFRDGIQGLRRCGEALARGDGLLVFPEGTRSPDGRLQPFKTGVALLSVQGGAPVIPVHISGTHALLAKGRVLVKPGTIEIAFGAPLLPPPLAEVAEMQVECRTFTDRIEAAVRTLGSDRKNEVS